MSCPILVARVGLVLGLVLALSVVGCGAPAAPPNIVVIVVDTLRADHLSTYGYVRPTCGSFA